MNWFRSVPKHLPVATGSYVPGMMDVMLGYSSEAPFFRLYYPTNTKFNLKENSKKWIPWVPDESYLLGISKVIMTYHLLIRLVFWWTDKIRIPSLYGEKIRTEDTLKCIVMSHGLGGNRFLYTNICCELASRGFLVAAIEHKDYSACNTYYYLSKEHAKLDKRTTIDFKHVPLGREHYSKRNSQIKHRANEVCKVLDFLINVQNGTDVPYNVMDDVPPFSNIEIYFKLADLVGKLDTSTVTVMGHSFGAATALYSLSERQELKQGILLDPWMFPIKNEELDKKIAQPMLFINTQTFHIASNVKTMSTMLKNDSTKMYTICHTTHENQTDSVLVVGYWLNWFMKKLDPQVALKINNSLILTFLNQYVRHPEVVSEMKSYLETQKDNIEEGLTKPWA